MPIGDLGLRPGKACDCGCCVPILFGWQTQVGQGQRPEGRRVGMSPAIVRPRRRRQFSRVAALDMENAGGRGRARAESFISWLNEDATSRMENDRASRANRAATPLILVKGLAVRSSRLVIGGAIKRALGPPKSFLNPGCKSYYPKLRRACTRLARTFAIVGPCREGRDCRCLRWDYLPFWKAAACRVFNVGRILCCLWIAGVLRFAARAA